MAPARIMFIRHAEKPDASDRGVALDGSHDPESLTPRGWQRAGALARFFHPASAVSGNEPLKPAVVFAAGIGAGSKSKRSIDTVTPLVEFLKQTQPTPFITSYPKDDHQALIDDVLSRAGPVLIAWEHKEIPAIIALLPQAPAVPGKWADDRFDMVWIFDRTPAGWRFSQKPQLLLSGDRADPIQ
jgi:broad specificity phosphatase PhoE